MRVITARHIGAPVLAAAALLLAGCGLAEHGQRMDTVRQRLENYDLENKHLGGPLEMPTTGKDDEWPDLYLMKVFLRPPRGTAKDPSTAGGPYEANGLVLYRYAGPAGDGVFLAARQGDPKADGEKTVRGFHEDVIAALRAYHRAEHRQDLAVPAGPETATLLKPLQTGPVAPKAIHFDHVVCESPPTAVNPSSFRVYFHQSSQDQAALIYQVPRTSVDVADLSTKVDLSLKSFAVGPAATQRRHQYNATHRPPVR